MRHTCIICGAKRDQLYMTKVGIELSAGGNYWACKRLHNYKCTLKPGGTLHTILYQNSSLRILMLDIQRLNPKVLENEELPPITSDQDGR